MGRPAINETGKRYGKLTVLRRATPDEYQSGQGLHAVWLCRCDCGKEIFAQGSSLRNGKQISCGCAAREKAVELARALGKKRKAQLQGQKFGSLTVLEESNRYEDINHKETIWKCKCDCGTITYVRSTYLTSGHTKSCGCQRFMYNGKGGSQGEQLIVSLLDQNQINYEREKIFKDLRAGLYRFDFYIPLQNTVIEYNGQQHYQYVPIFYKSQSEFLKGQERDRRKIAYCLAHDIKIYCIPYWEIGNLENLDDLFQEKFLAKSKFHNDEAWRIQKNRQ